MPPRHEHHYVNVALPVYPYCTSALYLGYRLATLIAPWRLTGLTKNTTCYHLPTALFLSFNAQLPILLASSHAAGLASYHPRTPMPFAPCAALEQTARAQHALAVTAIVLAVLFFLVVAVPPRRYLHTSRLLTLVALACFVAPVAMSAGYVVLWSRTNTECRLVDEKIMLATAVVLVVATLVYLVKYTSVPNRTHLHCPHVQTPPLVYDYAELLKRVRCTRKSFDDEDCPICLEQLSGSPVSALDCNHRHHERCLLQWLSSTGRAPDCPLCKAPIDVPTIDNTHKIEQLPYHLTDLTVV